MEVALSQMCRADSEAEAALQRTDDSSRLLVAAVAAVRAQILILERSGRG